MSILENINGHSDLIKLSSQQQTELCQEIRDFLVEKVSQNGGHLASNLGAVELTLAIETVFDTAVDRLVFDVGHQSYVHKILSGRRDDFNCLRQMGGIAGFPKPCESAADAFTAGHASSSVSIALGMARARTLQNQKYAVIAMIGDGATTGGLSYEGMNDAGTTNEPLIIILNDNAMSINKNVGGLSKHLTALRMKDRYLGMKSHVRSKLKKVPGGAQITAAVHDTKEWVKRLVMPTTVFEEMGLDYLGPVDGHDLAALIHALKVARSINRPVILHVLTKKGMGYKPAELQPAKFHGIGKFDPKTGELVSRKSVSFSDAFGDCFVSLLDNNASVCGISAAMLSGTGMLLAKEKHQKRVWDVGIAEGHAVSLAGGLAKQGMIPVVAIYSTFLQRAYDMIFQDVAMQNLHVVFAVDRAGLVGEDGETHHGIYDVGFLRQIPNMCVLCPGSCQELSDMLTWAVEKHNGPVAVRYPRGGDGRYCTSAWPQKTDFCSSGNPIAIISYGTIYNHAAEAAEALSNEGIQISSIRLLQIEPIPYEEILPNLFDVQHLFIVEEIAEGSGIAEDISWEIYKRYPNIHIHKRDLGKRFVTHGSMASLYQLYGMDANSLTEWIRKEI